MYYMPHINDPLPPLHIYQASGEGSVTTASGGRCLQLCHVTHLSPPVRTEEEVPGAELQGQYICMRETTSDSERESFNSTLIPGLIYAGPVIVMCTTFSVYIYIYMYMHGLFVVGGMEGGREGGK